MAADTTLLTVTIPAAGVAAVSHKVDLMTRRCARKGMPAPTLREIGRHFEPDMDAPVPAGTPVALRPKVEMVDLELLSPGTIELGGWSLLGRVDGLPDGSALVARTPGTEMMPMPYVASPYACAHCGKLRTRTETFLVYNAGGEVRQVGRNCLRDFLGHDPASLLWWHKELGVVLSSFGGSPRGEYFWDTDEVLALAARVAAHGGFLGQAKAREINDDIDERPLARRHVLSSAAEVAWRLDPPPVGSRARVYQTTLIAAWDERYPDDEAAFALLTATKAALASLAPQSEWEANLVSVCGQPQLRQRHLNIAVSAVILGLRAQEREETRARRVAMPSAHIGAIGERLTMTATIGFMREFPSDFGTRTLIKFDAPGSTLMWWATASLWRDNLDPGRDWTVGDEVILTGTVKAHETDRYDGRPVTLLSRCILRPAPVAVLA